MIRFTDKNYFYTGPVEDGVDRNKYRINTAKIDELIAQRHYQEAMDYMKQFHYDDIFKEQDWRAKIDKVRDMYKQSTYLYGSLEKDSPEMQAVDFGNLILRPGGWKLIDNNNVYKQRFGEIKRNLGNTSLGIATSLEVEFSPKKQYGNLFGFDVDVLERDNDITIDNFYKHSGLTKEDLKAAGIAPWEKDGRTVITFSKESPLANQILYGLGALMANEEGKYFNLIGYDADGKKLDQEVNEIRSFLSTDESSPALPFVNSKGETTLWDEHGNINTGYTAKFRDWTVESKNFIKDLAGRIEDPIHGDLANTPNYREPLEELYNSINQGSKITEQLAADINNKKEALTAEYNTTIFGYLSDQVQTEFEMMNRGELDRQIFNTNRKEYETDYAAQLAGLGESNYEFYSNWNKPEGELELMNAEDKRDILNHMLAAYKAGRVHIQVAESGGELGAYLSIVPEEKKDLIHEKDNETIDIFIPGLWADVAEKRIANNSTYKARKEVQDMELLGYEYHTEDGNTISVKAYNSEGKETSFRDEDSLNRVFYVTDSNGNTRQIDKAEALTRIDKSIIMEDAVQGIMNKYSNLYGKITDHDAVIAEIRRLSKDAVNSLYPNMISLSEADIFDNAVVKDENGDTVIDGVTFNPTADEELTWQAYQKTKEAYDIYNYILNNLIFVSR